MGKNKDWQKKEEYFFFQDKHMFTSEKIVALFICKAAETKPDYLEYLLKKMSDASGPKQVVKEKKTSQLTIVPTSQMSTVQVGNKRADLWEIQQAAQKAKHRFLELEEEKKQLNQKKKLVIEEQKKLQKVLQTHLETTPDKEEDATDSKGQLCKIQSRVHKEKAPYTNQFIRKHLEIYATDVLKEPASEASAWAEECTDWLKSRLPVKRVTRVELVYSRAKRQKISEEGGYIQT